MASVIKLRLKDGEREIEVEGVKEDIDSILDRWWLGGAFLPDDIRDQGENRVTPPAKKKTPRRARKVAKEKKETPPQSPELEPHAVANRVKEDERFDRIQKKILHVAADYIHKAAFVLWFVNKPLSSGQVHKILQALDIRVGQPRVSEALKDHSFIASGQRARGVSVEYRLTARAKAEFEQWLMEDGS